MLDAVHLPDGFLSAGVAAVTWAGAGASLAGSLAAERREGRDVPAGVLGALAAFVFAAQMVNVPVAPGTSGHLVGATLVALLVGPWRSLVVMAVVLAIQALLFQDGGITTYGANLLDMGVVGSLVGFAVAWITSGAGRSLRGIAAGGVLGAFAATLAASTLAAIWLSLSGLYPLALLLPIMLTSHVAIGLLEAALTGGILVTILKWRPDLVRGFGAGAVERRPAALTLGVLGLALAVAAFVAPYASVLPDGLDATAKALGFATKAKPSFPAPLAGYNLPFATSLSFAPVAAGSVGTLAAAVLAWVLGRSLRSSDHASHR
jgi:cobalt/nickel transport system permease protein